MARVDEYLALIDDPAHPPLDRPHPDDDVLLSLLVHLANSDGVVEGDEFALLKRVLPELGDSELMMWLTDSVGHALDGAALRRVLPTAEARWSAVRLAARMAALDGDVAQEERVELVSLTELLELPAHRVDDAIDEIVATTPARPGALASALRGMFWDALVPDRDELTSDLAAVVPDGASPVCRVLLRDDTEVAGLFQEGLVMRFDAGPAFVRWSDVERYTRVPVPGAAFHLGTAQGSHAASDARLKDVGALLDVIYGRVPTNVAD